MSNINIVVKIPNEISIIEAFSQLNIIKNINKNINFNQHLIKVLKHILKATTFILPTANLSTQIFCHDLSFPNFSSLSRIYLPPSKKYSSLIEQIDSNYLERATSSKGNDSLSSTRTTHHDEALFPSSFRIPFRDETSLDSTYSQTISRRTENKERQKGRKSVVEGFPPR